MRISLLILVLLITVCSSDNPHQDEITKLHKQLYQNYWSKNTTLKFMRSWHHIQGLFSSAIHFNMVDKNNGELAAFIRRNLKIDDENNFVTSFVLYGLLQAQQLGTIQIDVNRFNRSLQALLSFRDKNQPEEIPIYTFWPQKLINGTWSCVPTNIFTMIDLMPNLPDKVQKFVSDHGLPDFAHAKVAKKQFHVPADLDDSSVNIALLSYLKALNLKPFLYWQKQNFNFDAFYKKVLYYAYRPFAPTSKRSDQIDPRTYYAIHKFLKCRKEQAKTKGKQPSLVLPTTWLLFRQETKPQIIGMPLSMNNVDASVNANFIFGLIYQMQHGFQPGTELRAMMRDVTDFLIYTIQDAIHERPDLILLYYPSKYEFYWFVGRIIGLLQRMPKLDKDRDLKYVYDRLGKAMKDKGTKTLVDQKFENQNGIYWVQFLGNFGGKNRTEDSIYSTAMVLNSLLDTWGVKGNKSFKYIDDTPDKIKDVIEKGIRFLCASVKAKAGRLSNAFFSGSMKIKQRQFPGYFPANKIVDKDNKSIDAQTASLDDYSNKVFDDVVKGFIDDEKYQQMLKLKWFTSQVPIEFKGYNEGKGLLFAFWGSPAITQIIMITALSKYYRATS